MRNTLLVLVSAVVVTASTGCLGDEGLLAQPTSAPQSDTYKINVATDLIPEVDPPGGTEADTSTESDSAPLAFSADELGVLEPLLSGLLDGAGGDNPVDLLDGSLTWRDLKQLDLHRRDFAALALDLVATRDDLSTDQQFALRLARAIVMRDDQAIGNLLLERVLPLLVEQMQASDGDAEGL
jgi:hypothetical protein